MPWSWLNILHINKNMGCYSLPPLQESRPEIQSEKEKEGFASVFNDLLEEVDW